MINKILTGIILVCLIFGCVSDISDDNNEKDNDGFNNIIMTNQSLRSDFNKETYIWESFIFPTNRVMDRK